MPVLLLAAQFLRSRPSRVLARAALPCAAALALGFLLTLAGGGCSSRDPNVLVVGMELSYPPFEMTDERGQPTGIGVEIAQALAADLHRQLRIENIPFDGLITALKTGRIDLVLSSMTVRPDRAESIDFSDPYITTGLAILVPTNSPVRSIADVDKPGYNVVVKSGTTGALYVKEHFTQAQARVLGDEANCALEVSQGKAQAFLYDQFAVYQHQKRYPTTTRAILEPFQHESWAIGLQKGNDSLRRQVNAFLAKFKAEHRLEALGEKYLKADREVFAQMGYPFSS